MQCRNCKNTLSGDEDFCPRCGIPQKLTDISTAIKDIAESAEEKSDSPEKSSIFHNEPVYIYTDPPKEAETKKSKAATVFVSLFIITLLLIGAVTLSDYFNLVPALSDLFVSDDITEPSDETLTYEESDTTLGVIPPDINFKSHIYTVSSQAGLPLRKGPDNSYAMIDSVSYGTDVQLIGRSLQNNLWGYVYVPSLDYYGWLMCSYLTDDSQLKETAPEKDDNQQKDTAPADSESPQETAVYSARVTAEKGLYLRVGPGTDYEAISVIGNGETVTVMDVSEDDSSWLYVSFNDISGYMNKAYLEKNPI